MDTLVDWLFRAYAGSLEVHEMEPPLYGNSRDRRCLVLVIDRPFAVRYIAYYAGSLQLQIVSPAGWAEMGAARDAAPDGSEAHRAPRASWYRTAEHDDTQPCVERLTLTNFRCFTKADLAFTSSLNVLIDNVRNHMSHTEVPYTSKSHSGHLALEHGDRVSGATS
jgi:hypothetical protein